MLSSKFTAMYLLSVHYSAIVVLQKNYPCLPPDTWLLTVHLLSGCLLPYPTVLSGGINCSSYRLLGANRESIAVLCLKALQGAWLLICGQIDTR